MLERMVIQYICPECGRHVTREVPYAKENKNLELTSAGWCSFQYCEARHKITYRVKQKDVEKPTIKIIEFTSNDAVCNKRFQILEWSGMEQATKKRKKK